MKHNTFFPAILVLGLGVQFVSSEAGAEGLFSKMRARRAEKKAAKALEQKSSSAVKPSHESRKASTVNGGSRSHSKKSSSSPVREQEQNKTQPMVSAVDLLPPQNKSCAEVPLNVRGLVASHMVQRKLSGSKSSDAQLAHEAAKMMGLLFYRSFYNSAEGFVNVWNKENTATKVGHPDSGGFSSHSRLSRVSDIDLSNSEGTKAGLSYGLGGITADRFVIGGHGQENFRLLQYLMAQDSKSAWETCSAGDFFSSKDQDQWKASLEAAQKALKGHTSSRANLAAVLRGPEVAKARALERSLGGLLSLCPALNLGVMGREIHYAGEKALYFGGKAEGSDWSKAQEVCFDELQELVKNPGERLEALKEKSFIKKTAEVVAKPVKWTSGKIKNFFSRLKKNRGDKGEGKTEVPSVSSAAAPAPQQKPEQASQSLGYSLSPRAASGLSQATQVNAVMADLHKLHLKVESDAYAIQVAKMSEEKKQEEFAKLEAEFRQLDARLKQASSGIDFKVHKSAGAEIGKAQAYVEEALKGFEDISEEE